MNKKSIRVLLPGFMEYNEALKLQQKLLKARQEDQIQDTLLLLQHPPVLTMGKRAQEGNILLPVDILKDRGIDVVYINRGGDVTYHGPGQIVGYPIMDLNNYGRDIRNFVSNIEEIFIRLLKEEYDIIADRDTEHRGVWVGNEKITAIGFSIKRWVSMHGFAFNVNTNLEHFNWIVPCGITEKGVTSMQKILGYSLDMDKVIDQVIEYFTGVFNITEISLNREV
jgi:lipoyl(octanoyl) transferase